MVNNLWQNRYRLGGFLGIAVLIFGIAYQFAKLEYRAGVAEIEYEKSQQFGAWVRATNETIISWRQRLITHASTISDAEMFRLFMQDISDADAATINAAENTDDDKAAPELADLVEQIPLLRNMLYEYLNYNALLDVRLLNTQVATILSALPRSNPLTLEQKIAVVRALKENRLSCAPIRGSATSLIFDYAVPIRALNNNEPIGALLLSAPLTADLAKFLGREMRRDGTQRSYLVQKNGDVYQNVEVHSSAPINLEVAFNFTDELPFARRASVAAPSATAPEVYSYGQKVPELEWWIILETPEEIINAQFATLGYSVYGIALLAATGLLLLLALGWWIVIGKAQQAAAAKFKNLYDVIAQQKGILDSINVSLQVGLTLVDHAGRLRLVNRSFAQMLERDETALHDATLMAVFDAKNANLLCEKIKNVAATNTDATVEISLTHGGEEFLYRVTLYPFYADAGEMDALPIADGAVAIFQDITEFRRASERSQQQQINLVNALVSAIESIDPYLTGHSQMMSDLGDLIGEALAMSPAEREILRNAAIFSQFGKLFIPREILLKTEKLTPEELAILRQIPEKGYAVLAGVGFDLTTAQAVRQMYEQIDGNGYPQHLRGEEISVYGRILAITNALAAMLSKRAFRERLTLSEALERLQHDIYRFDQNLVATLKQVLDTQNGATVVARYTAD